MGNKKKLALSFIIGLLSGAILMGAGLGCWRGKIPGMGLFFSGGRHGRGGAGPGRMLEKFTRHLDLKPEQKAGMEKVLDDSMKKMRELREKVHPQFVVIREGAEKEIESILDPEQRTKFKGLMERREKWRRKWMGDR